MQLKIAFILIALVSLCISVSGEAWIQHKPMGCLARLAHSQQVSASKRKPRTSAKKSLCVLWLCVCEPNARY
jgi:hypothetical protein